MGEARRPAVTGTSAEVAAGGLDNSGSLLASPEESLLQAGLNGQATTQPLPGSEAALMAHRTRVAGQQRIGGDQQQPFALRLGQQQAIEGIAVQGGGSWTTASPWAASIGSSTKPPSMSVRRSTG